MKCPSCRNELSSLEVGGVTVDVCKGHCGGIWFDKSELARFDEPHDEATGQILRAIPNATVVIDHNRERHCPCCSGTALSRTFYDDQYNIEIDQCPNCSGTWLDLGELQRIRNQNKTSKEREKAYNDFLNKPNKDGSIPKGMEAVLKLIF